MSGGGDGPAHRGVPDVGALGAAGAQPPAAEPVRCTWCGSADVERIAAWGPQLLTEQFMCLGCRSPFEWIRRR